MDSELGRGGDLVMLRDPGRSAEIIYFPSGARRGPLTTSPQSKVHLCVVLSLVMAFAPGPPGGLPAPLLHDDCVPRVCQPPSWATGFTQEKTQSSCAEGEERYMPLVLVQEMEVQ